MIDIHTHILANIDDGAANWQESLDLAHAAVQEGITGLIATPHHANGRYSNYAQDIRMLVSELQNQLEAAHIPLKVYAGQEVRVHTDLLLSWENQELQTLADSNYLLLEMPSTTIPERLPDLIYELQLLDVKTVIAHPERNAEVVRNPDRLRRLVEEGAYTQVTTHSLLGGFGKQIEKSAWHLCEQGLIHLVSSDAHHLQRRGFRLAEAYRRIGEVMGEEAVASYQQNALSVLESKDLLKVMPYRKKSRFGWSNLLKWHSYN